MNDELSKEQEADVMSRIEDLEQSIAEWVNSDNVIEVVDDKPKYSFKRTILTAIQNKFYKKD